MHGALVYAAIFIGGGFFGWGVDTASRSLTAGYFAPGTLLPYFSLIFASGAVMLFTLFRIRSIPFWLSVVLGTVLCVALEFFSGLVSYSVLHRRFWDYTGEPFNLYGFIDLRHAIYWFILTFLYRLFYRLFVEHKRQ